MPGGDPGAQNFPTVGPIDGTLVRLTREFAATTFRDCYMDFAELAKDGRLDAVAVRRDLHRHPEVAFLEYRTASKVAAYLSGLGFAVKAGPQVMASEAIIAPPSPAAVQAAQAAAIAAGGHPGWIARMPDGQTGVVAELRRGAGPVVAFRFDMDALPVRETASPRHEPNRGGFRSCRDGFMHACGHDGHVAIGLDVATKLAADARWSGTLRLIFQPAEEGGRGAEPMVAAGVVDDVDCFFVGHLGCLLGSGKVAAQATDFAHATRWDVTFRGRSAHAAMGPQDGANAILAAATATLSLHAIARHGDAATFVNVGSIAGGSARNLVADRCDLVMEVRGMSAQAHGYMQRRAREILTAAAAMHGAEMEIVPMGGMIGNDNSPEAAAIVAAAAGEVEGIAEIVEGWPIGGGDDATFMIRRVQERGGIAGYFLIGSDIPAVHHAADFDIDERSLRHGADVFAAIARKTLGAAAPG